MKKNNKLGFTLVEVMIVAIIVGILAAIAIPAFNSTSGNSANSVFEKDGVLPGKNGTLNIDGEFYGCTYNFQTIGCGCDKYNQLSILDSYGETHTYIDYDRDGSLTSHKHDSYAYDMDLFRQSSDIMTEYDRTYKSFLTQLVAEENMAM